LRGGGAPSGGAGARPPPRSAHRPHAAPPLGSESPYVGCYNLNRLSSSELLPLRPRRTPCPLPLPLQVGWGEGERQCFQPGHASASATASCSWVWLFLSLPFSCWSVLFPIARFAWFRASRHTRGRKRKQDSQFMLQFWKLVHSTRPVRPSQRPQSGTSNAIRWSSY
jgi:hypothetical protein